MAFFFLLSTGSAQTTNAWTNTGTVSGNWSETSNWAGSVVPGATSGTANSDTATFNTAVGTYGTSGSPVLIDSGRNIKNLTFSGSAGNYTIGTTGGNALLLSAGGEIRRDALTTGSNVITINAPLQLQGNYGIYNNNNQSGGFSIGGAISGTATAGNIQSLGFNGWGAANNNNVISGAITDGVNGGSVRVFLYGPSTWTLSGTSVIRGGVGVGNAPGANGILRNTGNLTAGGTATGTVNTVDIGTFDNQGQLTLTGELALNNDASLFINSGTIGMSGWRGIGLNQGSRFTNSGSINVGGIDVGAWGADGGAAATSTFNNNTGGNISVWSLIVGSWKFGTFNNTGGNVTVGGALRIGKGSNGRTAQAGTSTFTLTSGTVTVNAGATIQLGGDGTATDTAGVLDLNGGTMATAVGVTGPSGTRNTGTVNFNGGTLRGTGANVTLLGTNLTAVNIRTNGATVDVGVGLTNTISANLLDGGGNGGLTKTGVGTLTLSGNNTYTGNTTVSDGTLSIGNNSSSTFAASSTITISSGAQLNLPNAATNIVRTLILGPQTYTSGTFNSSNFGGFITGSGTIQVGAAVEPSYSDWASDNALTGTSADDYDGDGVSNGLEYVLGGDRYTNDSGKMPEVTVTEGNMIFTFVRSQASINAKTDVDILVGTDLVAWPTVYTVGTDTAGSTSGVTITKGSPVAGKDTVSLTVTMSSDPKKFARLRVITK